ncbi:MAG: hypothetical protein IJ215_00040 [Clostridia bacterium]|nr:hypothetical protein [Clostridia bacterium]
MKKILTVVPIVAILFLTGCNKSEIVENTYNQQQEVIDNIQSAEENLLDNNIVSKDNENAENTNNENFNNYFPILTKEEILYEDANKGLTEEELIEKYKLADGYFLDDYDIEEIDYNIISHGEIINTNYEFVSDDIKFMMICNKDEKNEYGIPDYEITLNGKRLWSPYSEQAIVFDIGVVDIDKNDNYKDLVIYETEGLDRRDFYLSNKT